MGPIIVLAGGSGFLGQALAARLLNEGCDVRVLSGAARGILGSAIPWDGATLGPWVKSLEGAMAVINFTGKNINCRLSAANVRQIVSSRVNSVQAVSEAIRRCQRPPNVFVQTSAVGIYGDTGDIICDETTPAGGGFLGDTCVRWERAFEECATPGVRRVLLRLGVVLGRGGGAFPPLARLARFFLGGAVGSGRQYISWLHLADAVRIYCRAIERDDFEGVYVSAAPQAVTNTEFMRALRGVLHRPWSPPVPALAARIGGWLAGMNVNVALTGQRCVPQRLIQKGFAFDFGELGAALKDLVR